VTTDWGQARLHVVTGKGGTGKTTVASALALALASTPGRVLLTEVEGRQGISQTFDVPPLGTQETRVVRLPGGGEVDGLSVEPKAALLEYLQLFYKLGRAGRLLEKFGAIDFATTIAPGVRDVLLIGKVYEANRRRRDGRHRGDAPPAYDGLVLDAPPTGRIGRFLSVNSEVAHLARVGPIHSQAESITRLLQSEQTVVHLVTLLEEMPVQETLEAVEELRAKGFRPGAIVVNMVRRPLLDDAALDQARAERLHKPSIRAQLVDAGVIVTPELVDGLLAEAHDHAQRVDLEREQRTLLEETGLPIIELPALPEGIDSGSVRELADLLVPCFAHEQVPS
jgi:anion-transporting  ArsA/GET3 family ATPase